VTQGLIQELPAPADALSQTGPAQTLLIVRIFAIALGVLLVGYMFAGRGFAHIGLGPIYVGDVVLFLGVVASAFVLLRTRTRPRIGWTIALLVAFAALGALRTLPYLGMYGMDALRDAVLWGYAAFALIVYLMADRQWVLSAFRIYGWIVPIFALWLPICWNIFSVQSLNVDPLRQGSDVPLVVFKSGDIAVHAVGALAFLVIGAGAASTARTFLWRVIIVLPLLWAIFVAGTTNRGALLTAAFGIVGIALLAPRSRTWLPILAAAALFTIAIVFQGLFTDAGAAAPSPTPRQPPIASGSISSSASASPSPTIRPSASPRGSSSPLPSGSPPETMPGGRSTPRPSAEGDELEVVNPRFELGPVGGGTIEGWTPRGAQPDVVEGGAYEGDRFASIENAGDAYEATLTSSMIPFEGGEDIAVSVWAKAVSARPILEIYVNWYDRTGDLISSDYMNSLSTRGVGTWQECAGVLAAPTNTSHAEVLFYEARGGGATFGIDQVSVRSGDYIDDPVPPGGLAIANPGFERGRIDSGIIEGWTIGGLGSYNIVGKGGYGGTNFASVENVGDAYEATLTSSAFQFDAQNDIAVSLWAKGIEARPTIEIYINWYDTFGDLISSDFLGSVSMADSRGWREGTGVLGAPATATQAQILVYEASGRATVGIDEVTVRTGDFIAEPAPAEGRPATFQQLIENILSVFGSSSDGGLEGTKQFRLAWWKEIVDYTVFGEYFWPGKGFGVNLADDDGFQSTADGSLRAPHNSHITVLARMGVPGLVLWLLVQGAFILGLLKAVRAHMRDGDARVAAVGAWILAYWFAMMIDTSFDPYLEGPQGGIWFWAIVGLGLVVIRLRPPRRRTVLPSPA
jgi:hypothetical protein